MVEITSVFVLIRQSALDTHATLHGDSSELTHVFRYLLSFVWTYLTGTIELPFPEQSNAHADGDFV